MLLEHIVSFRTLIELHRATFTNLINPLFDMLSQLVYTSTRQASCTEEEIQKILSACQRNNRERNITGILLYSTTHFVQYLEGSYRDVIGLYDTIKEDERHANAIMIGSRPIEERLFPSWQMGAKKLYSVEYQTDIDQEEMATFQDILVGKGKAGSDIVATIEKFFR